MACSLFLYGSTQILTHQRTIRRRGARLGFPLEFRRFYLTREPASKIRNDLLGCGYIDTLRGSWKTLGNQHMDPFSCRYAWTGKQARAERCRNIPCSLFPVWPKSKLRYDVCVESKRILPYLGTKNNNMSNGKFQAVQGLSGSRLVVALVKKINESTPGMQAYVSMPRTVR